MWKVTPYLCPYNMHYIDTVGRFVSLLVCLQYTSLYKHVCIQYASVCISMCMYASEMHTHVLYTERVRALQCQGLSAYDKVTCAYRYLHTHTHIFMPRITHSHSAQTQSHQHLYTYHAYICTYIHSHQIYMYLCIPHTDNVNTWKSQVHTTHTRICQALNLHV